MSKARSKPWEHAKSGEGSASDPLAARFVESLSYDTRLYDADIRGSLAHAAMLRELALSQGGIVMPGYTHLQRAQPICLGGELMAWHAMFSRDRDEFLRLSGTPSPGNPSGESLSPLGSGAAAGSSLPLDRDMTAAAL